MLHSPTNSKQSSGDRLEIPLVSGAIFPDWSAVSSDRVRASLGDTLGRLRMTKRWVGMSENEEAVRRSVLRHFATHGQAPQTRDLSNDTGLTGPTVRFLLNSLRDRDLIVCRDTDASIEGAYPFTDRKTEHRMLLNNVTLNAMCAIDALGAGAMLNTNSVIMSACRHCQQTILVETKDHGRMLDVVLPRDVVVWSGVQEIDGCAADTQCTVMAFFCSDNHLMAWREENASGERGHKLSVAEGLEAGAAIFIPFLADASAKDLQTERLTS